MYRIRLNTGMRDNNAFFCPDTRLHLTLTNPVDSVDRVSPAIERGIKGKALIDMDGLLKPGKGDAKPEQPAQDTKNDDVPPEEQKETPVEAPKQEEQPPQEPEQIPQEPEQPAQEPIQEPAQEPAQQPEGDIFSQLEGAAAPAEPEAPKTEKKPAAKKSSKAKAAKAAE